MGRKFIPETSRTWIAFYFKSVFHLPFYCLFIIRERIISLYKPGVVDYAELPISFFGFSSQTFHANGNMRIGTHE